MVSIDQLSCMIIHDALQNFSMVSVIPRAPCGRWDSFPEFIYFLPLKPWTFSEICLCHLSPFQNIQAVISLLPPICGYKQPSKYLKVLPSTFLFKSLINDVEELHNVDNFLGSGNK